MESNFQFKILKKSKDSLARAGEIITPHGTIQTPAFVVVGTKATAKALIPEMLKDIGVQAVLANTYHLYLQPGDEIIASSGGFGKFMNWDGPTMTDSGGFQAFSLGEALGKNISKIAREDDNDIIVNPKPAVGQGGELKNLKLASIDENGVTFKSHIDGSEHYLTPEKSMEIQWNLGADIIFAFDECTSPVAPYEYQREAMERTHRWAKRSLARHSELDLEEKQALFGIVQGGRFQDLREESAKTLAGMDFDGYGIGGSFNKEDMDTAVGWVNKILPENKPRHLLGIGEPEDIKKAIEQGCDLFDCVVPTRNARNGRLYTKDGYINVLNSSFRNDFTSIESGCECYTCRNYTKAYLAHLFRAKELLANTLASIHNLYFIVHFMEDIRKKILDS